MTIEQGRRAARGPRRSYYAPTGRQVRTSSGLVDVWEFAGEWRPYGEQAADE